MFESQILDVAIGLAFVYIILSLICTTIDEWIASILSLRARTLVAAIQNLIKGKDPQGKELTDSFFEHSLIKALSSKARKLSYIPSHTFALTLIDIIAPKVTAGSKMFKDFGKAVDNLQESDVKKTLQLFTRQKKEEIEKVQENIERWFDDTMDRVKGWYKRKIQLITICTAVVVSVGLNVDTFEIANSLYRDGTLRALVVAVAVEAVKKTESTEQQNSSNIVENASEKLQGLQLPIGWSGQRQKPINLPNKVLGWLVTAVALSLGAPFWFDVLNRFMKLRASGKNPEEKGKKEEKKNQ
jgi:hypothetical protein